MFDNFAKGNGWELWMGLGANSVPKQPRFGHLDGLRTIAIFWVALYHYAVFWTPAGKGEPLMPQGDALSWIPMASVGHLGVNLFFILSGFVIFYSLDRSKSLMDFAVKRTIRLWPTYLFCATLTFSAALMVGPAELVREPIEYLISLTFMPPNRVGQIFGHPEWRWLDGAYWSLWVEVRFYVIVSVLFFATGMHFFWSWIGFNVIALIIHLQWMLTGGPVANDLSGLLFAEYLPFFNVGISLALLHKGQMNGQGKKLVSLFLLISILQTVIYSSTANGAVEYFIGLTIVFLISVIAVLAPHKMPFLNQKYVVLIGQSSYVFYLLHQNFFISIIHHFNFDNGALEIIVLIIGFSFILALSVILHLIFEIPVQKHLKQLIVLVKAKPRSAAAHDVEGGRY